MARGISLKIGGDCFNLAPVKVERRKMYGWTEVKVWDSNQGECRQVNLDANGVTVIPSGAIKQGILGDNGKWVEKTELQPVHADGTKAELRPSSFDTGIVLNTKASPEDYLDLLVTSVYVLNGEGSEDLAKKVGNDIYSFRFNYRSDYEDSPAFLLSNGQSVFIVTGQNAKYSFLSLEESGDLTVDEEETDDFDIDDLDFGMM